MSQEDNSESYFGCGCLTFIATGCVIGFFANIIGDYKLMKALDNLYLAGAIIIIILLLILFIVTRFIR